MPKAVNRQIRRDRSEVRSTELDADRPASEGGAARLQRRFGNQAVQRLVAVESPSKPNPAAGGPPMQPKLAVSDPCDRYEREAEQIVAGRMAEGSPWQNRRDAFVGRSDAAATISRTPARTATATEPPTIQRQTSGVQVRVPPFEEAVTQASAVAGAVAGRLLTDEEREVAESVFKGSIDPSQVRLVAGAPVTWVTVGNTVYVPEEFTIDDPIMRQTFVHELTHVWQYQRAGTGYISGAFFPQVLLELLGKERNLEYDYTPTPGKSLFEYRPEQQALIVENYFAMERDRQLLAGGGAPAGRTFVSNHLAAGGNWQTLTAAERQREIERELPWHRERITELRAATPRSERESLEGRAMDVMGLRGPGAETIPEERKLVPVKPVLEVRF